VELGLTGVNAAANWDDGTRLSSGPGNYDVALQGYLEVEALRDRSLDTSHLLRGMSL
jgi:hypothetical protein